MCFLGGTAGQCGGKSHVLLAILRIKWYNSRKILGPRAAGRFFSEKDGAGIPLASEMEPAETL